MRLSIESPAGCESEKRYAFDVIFSHWLGLDFDVNFSNRPDYVVWKSRESGVIRIPDHFFSQACSRWLDPASVPTNMGSWLSEGGCEFHICQSNEISGVDWVGGESLQQLGTTCDIIGLVFFFLSRYEECFMQVEDEHGRFPSEASLAHRAGWLHRPVVDECVEGLRRAIERMWPGSTVPAPGYRRQISCDVDSPFEPYADSFRATLRRLTGDVLRRKSPRETRHTMANFLATRMGAYNLDRFDTFDWMMDVNESQGNRVVFYFISGITNTALDDRYKLRSRRIRHLMCRIHARGHEIGLHGSYGSMLDPDALVREAESLREVMALEGIKQSEIGLRQHYLRWRTPTTAKIAAKAGVRYDASLGFADAAGFRCGTCRMFPMYDPVIRKRIDLFERPLVAMEASLINAHSTEGEVSGAFQTLTELSRVCRTVGGDFSLLWHNSSLTTHAMKTTYLQAIAL